MLVDRVARYAEPRWFLNQFNCSLDNGLCVAESRLGREVKLMLSPDWRRALLRVVAKSEPQ